MPPKGTNFMSIVPEKKPEVSVKEPQCCEVFDRFCFGCLEIKNLKAHQAYRERLRRLMVVPTPGGDPGEQNHEFADLVPRNKTEKLFPPSLTGLLSPDELVDLVSDAEDDEKALEDDDDDDDDIAHDPEIRAMWARGEHTCTMFDAPCAVCEKDDEEDEEDQEEHDGEVRVMTEEEVQDDPEMTVQP
jgi:hypothetical protein